MHTPSQNKKVQRSRLLENDERRRLLLDGGRRRWRSCSPSRARSRSIVLSIVLTWHIVYAIPPIVVVVVGSVSSPIPFIRYAPRREMYASSSPLLSNATNKAKKKRGDRLSPSPSLPPPATGLRRLEDESVAAVFGHLSRLFLSAFLFLAVERIPLLSVIDERAMIGLSPPFFLFLLLLSLSFFPRPFFPLFSRREQIRRAREYKQTNGVRRYTAEIGELKSIRKRRFIDCCARARDSVRPSVHSASYLDINLSIAEISARYYRWLTFVCAIGSRDSRRPITVGTGNGGGRGGEKYRAVG